MSPVLLVLGALLQLFVADDLDALNMLPILDQMIDSGHWLRSYWFNLAVSPLIAFGAFLYLNRFIQTDAFLPRISNLPLFLTSISYFLISSTAQHAFVWIALWFFIFYIQNTFKVVNEGATIALSFNSGFILAIISFAHPALIAFGLLFFIASAYFGRLSLKSMLSLFLGVFTPHYLFAAMLYLLSIDKPSIFSGLVLDFSFDTELYQLLIWTSLIVLVLLVMLLQQGSLTSATLRIKRKWSLLSTTLILSAALGFAFSSQLFAVFGLIPGAVLFSQFFQSDYNPKVRDFVLVILSLCILGSQLV